MSLPESKLLDEIVARLIEVLPNILFALVIALLGWIVAKIVSRVIQKILEAIKIDQLSDKLNNIDLVSRANMQLTPSKIINKIVYYLILIVSLIAASEYLGISAISKLMSDLINYLPNFLSAVIIFIIGLFIADFIKNMVLNTCESLGIPSAKIIASIVFYFLFLTTSMSALDQAKISTDFVNSSFMIIISGIVASFALGYGLASKDMMANFLASFYVKDKFEAGDSITVDGVKGQIEMIDNKSFILKTDDRRVVFPLSKLAKDKVEIHS